MYVFYCNYMCLNAWCITILKFGCLGAQTYHRFYLNILLVWFKVGVPNAGSLLDSVLRSHCGQWEQLRSRQPEAGWWVFDGWESPSLFKKIYFFMFSPEQFAEGKLNPKDMFDEFCWFEMRSIHSFAKVLCSPRLARSMWPSSSSDPKRMPE